MTQPSAPTVPTPPPLRPGIATTEFWLTLATSVIAFLVGLGVVGPDFAKAHEQVVNALCLLAATVAPAVYAIARGLAKHGQQQAAAAVSVARLREDGYANINLLGIVLLVAGVVLAVLTGAVLPLVIGIVVAVIGLVLLTAPGLRL